MNENREVLTHDAFQEPLLTILRMANPNFKVFTQRVGSDTYDEFTNAATSRPSMEITEDTYLILCIVMSGNAPLGQNHGKLIFADVIMVIRH